MSPSIFWWLPGNLGVPRFVEVSLQPLLPSSWHSPFVPVSKSPLFYKDTSHWIRAHPTLVCLYLNLITSAENPLPNKVTYTGSHGHEFLGDIIQSRILIYMILHQVYHFDRMGIVKHVAQLTLVKFYSVTYNSF